VTRTAPEPQVAIVPPGLIDAAWPACRDWIEAALASTQQHEMSLDTVYERLQDREYLLLLMTSPGVVARDSGLAEIRACAVVAISVSAQSGKSYLGLIGAGGRGAHEWVGPLYRALRDLAIAEGCDRVLVVGRPGWRRLLLPLGARHVGEIIVMDNLKGGRHG
jgi:hypothetical protein